MIGLLRTMNSRLTISLFTALTLLSPTVVMAANQPVTIWVTADKLMPAWGFYPVSARRTAAPNHWDVAQPGVPQVTRDA